jgi:hypothetical protein
MGAHGAAVYFIDKSLQAAAYKSCACCYVVIEPMRPGLVVLASSKDGLQINWSNLQT